MCKHEFDGKKDIITNNGIVFVIYECVKCGKEFDQCIGETYPPNEKGDFD